MYVCLCRDVKKGEVQVSDLTNIRCGACLPYLLEELKEKLDPAYYDQIVKTTMLTEKTT
jgi:hypothetical protein